MNFYHDSNSIKHHGVLGMKWGIRKDRNSGSGRSKGGSHVVPKSGKGSKAHQEALVALEKAMAKVDNADAGWAQAYFKNGFKEDPKAEKNLQQALKERSEAKKAVKQAEKTHEVVAAEKAKEKAKSELYKADDKWVKEFAQTNNHVSKETTQYLLNKQAEYRKSKKDLYDAKIEPHKRKYEEAKKTREQAYKTWSKHEEAWLTEWVNNGSVKPETVSKADQALRTYRKASRDVVTSKVSLTFAKGKAGVERILG